MFLIRAIVSLSVYNCQAKEAKDDETVHVQAHACTFLFLSKQSRSNMVVIILAL